MSSSPSSGVSVVESLSLELGPWLNALARFENSICFVSHSFQLGEGDGNQESLSNAVWFPVVSLAQLV